MPLKVSRWLSLRGGKENPLRWCRVGPLCVTCGGVSDHVCYYSRLLERSPDRASPSPTVLLTQIQTASSLFLVQTAHTFIPSNLFFVCNHIANWLRGFIEFQVLISCVNFPLGGWKKAFKSVPGDLQCGAGEKVIPLSLPALLFEPKNGFISHIFQISACYKYCLTKARELCKLSFEIWHRGLCHTRH